MKTIIAGGGVSGLGAAKSRLSAGDHVTIIDQNNSLGGLTRSFCIDGFVFDYTGHLLHLNKASSLSEISPHLKESEWSSQKRYSGAFWNNQLIDAPFQYNLHQLNSEVQEKFKNSHSFSDYLVSNFGEELAREFLIPYNTKILGIELDKINHNAVTRFFPPPDEDLLLGKKVKEKKTYNTNFYYPNKSGIGVLIDALVNDIRGNEKLTILTGEKILSIDTQKKILFTDKNEYKYDIVISSIPLNKIGQIVSDVSMINQDVLSASKVFCLNIGYSEPMSYFEKYHWVYFPESDLPMYRIGFYSKFNRYMAPSGMESAYIECGLDERQDINIQDQTECILNCLEHRFGFKKSSTKIMTSNMICPGFVHYTHDRADMVENIVEKLKFRSIYQIGRYGLWYYNSMEDSYYSGYNLNIS